MILEGLLAFVDNLVSDYHLTCLGWAFYFTIFQTNWKSQEVKLEISVQHIFRQFGNIKNVLGVIELSSIWWAGNENVVSSKQWKKYSNL